MNQTKPIVLFYLLSCFISWPFMICMQFYPESWQALPLPAPLKTSLFMWGPGLAALMMLKLFNNTTYHTKRFKLFCGGKRLNISIYLIPSLIFVVMFATTLTTQQVLFFLTIYSAVAFFNTLGEELGWRGFLQPNLDCLPPVGQYLLIGLMWELWHLPMRLGAIKNGAPVDNMLLLSVGTITLSFIIGYAVKRTHSVTVAVCLHTYMNSLLTLAAISGISQQKLIPFFVFVAVFYLAVICFWQHPNLQFLFTGSQRKEI